jgi:hypothetical protein
VRSFSTRSVRAFDGERIPVGSTENRPLGREGREPFSSPAREVGSKHLIGELHGDIGDDPPAAREPSAGLAIEAAGDGRTQPKQRSPVLRPGQFTLDERAADQLHPQMLRLREVISQGCRLLECGATHTPSILSLSSAMDSQPRT